MLVCMCPGGFCLRFTWSPLLEAPCLPLIIAAMCCSSTFCGSGWLEN